jgi:hypothetical protein
MEKVDRPRFKWILSGLDFDDLTDWEEKFVESCELQLHFKEELSEKQSEILEKIYRGKGR